MVEHDVDVINMSVSYIWQGPGDGTSPFSNAIFVGVDAAITGGITWINSAGMQHKLHGLATSQTRTLMVGITLAEMTSATV